MQILADYHMHTRFSPDSRSEPEEMCRAAVAAGLSEIAVTDHFEFFPPGAAPDASYRVSILEAQQEALAQCREKFTGQLKIRSGIEIGQPQCDPAGVARLMEALSFDYIIGSIHKVEGVDLCAVEYTGETIPALVGKNLSMLLELADSGDFDCIGHLDLIKRYAARQEKKIDLMDYRDQVEPVLRRLAERGKGLEINTSGLRQAARSALPGLPLLKWFRELGGEVLTIGSDAHRPGDVGAGLAEAREIARQAGFRYLASFDRRKPAFYPIGD